MDNGPLIFAVGMIMFCIGMWVGWSNGLVIGRCKRMEEERRLWENEREQ